MRRGLLIALVSLALSLSSPLESGQIRSGDFVNPVVETFEGLGLPFNNTGPLILNGVTYITDTSTFRYANWVRFPVFFGIANDSDLGFIEVILETPVLRAGGWVAVSGGPVEFFDESNKLLGTVFLPTASGQTEIPTTFAGWQADSGLIRRIRFHDNSPNSRILVLGLVTREGSSQLPDLSVTKIEPVQVVFGSEVDNPPDGEVDLVLNKSTAVLVTAHVDNPTALRTSVMVDLQFQGATYTRGFQRSDLDSAGNAQITFDLVPTQMGTHQQMIATADPASAITESNEANNSLSLLLSVRQTRILHIPYVEITDCLLPLIPPSCYGPLDSYLATETFAQSRDFMRSTYPVSDIRTTNAGKFLGDGVPVVGVLDDMSTAFRVGQRADLNADRVIALVPSDYFAYHFKSNAAGLSLPGVNAVLSNVDYWMVPAHEIGHTFGLHRPSSWSGPGEEYETDPPGNCAEGFWVEQNVSVTDGICFMGSVPPTALRTLAFDRSCSSDPTVISRQSWIDKNDYESLFQTLKMPGDPETLILTGTISEDDTVRLPPWYVAQNGTSSAPNQGDYSIELVASNGRVVASNKFPVTFFIQLDYDSTPIYTGISPFGFSIPLPPGLFSVRITHGAKSLVEFDLSTKLLLDAIDSIPSRGFTDNADQRREALKAKVNAIGKMIRVGNLFGAEMGLTSDLRRVLGKWILDSYPIESPLEFSKSETLALVDEVVFRISTAP
jgi:hypothetical protein